MQKKSFCWYKLSCFNNENEMLQNAGCDKLLQQASFDSWLNYPTRLQLEKVLRTRVHYSPLQYTTENPPPSSYGGAILGTHAYLEAFSSFQFTCL